MPDPAKAEEKKPAEREKLHGQIVEVPPSVDDTPNPAAKYLSKYNTHVKEESVANSADRNPALGRVTHQLQTTEEERGPEDARTSLGRQATPPNPDGDQQPEQGEEGVGPEAGKRGEDPEKSRFVLELPNLERRDAVKLKLGQGPGIGQRIANRTGSEAMKGNADAFKLQLGKDGEDRAGSSGPGEENDGAGGEGKGRDKGPLTLAALMPNLGTVARISGSPSRDYVEGLQEGDGTFLNTREFKYATFFYRVRDSVASHWEGLALQEYRRRDPTGNIYGVRDRSTLLRIQLSRDGHLSDIHVEQTSGVDFLDTVAVEAFRKAEPFPNPPAGIMDEDGTIRFNFQFVVTTGPRSPAQPFQFR